MASALLSSLSMMRKLGALAGIVAILALAALLMWQVYLHHEGTADGPEMTVVELVRAHRTA